MLTKCAACKEFVYNISSTQKRGGKTSTTVKANMYTLDELKAKDFGEWDFYAFDDAETVGEFCADGDGFVSVQVQKDGSIRLLDQGDYMRDLSSDIDEAIKQATDYLREQWPNIYDMWFGGSEQ